MKVLDLETWTIYYMREHRTHIFRFIHFNGRVIDYHDRKRRHN